MKKSILVVLLVLFLSFFTILVFSCEVIELDLDGGASSPTVNNEYVTPQGESN